MEEEMNKTIKLMYFTTIAIFILFVGFVLGVESMKQQVLNNKVAIEVDGELKYKNMSR